MCVEIEVGEDFAECVGELRALMPAGVRFSADAPEGGKADDTCLCWVDVPETARANGLVVVEEAPMYFRLEPAGATA